MMIIAVAMIDADGCGCFDGVGDAGRCPGGSGLVDSRGAARGA